MKLINAFDFMIAVIATRYISTVSIAHITQHNTAQHSTVSLPVLSRHIMPLEYPTSSWDPITTLAFANSHPTIYVPFHVMGNNIFCRRHFKPVVSALTLNWATKFNSLITSEYLKYC